MSACISHRLHRSLRSDTLIRTDPQLSDQVLDFGYPAPIRYTQALLSLPRHPDIKHAMDDGAQQAEAAERFKQVSLGPGLGL